MTAPALQVSNLAVSYITARGRVNSLQGVDLTVMPGEILGVVGESGSGKSTLASAILGTLPTNASIEASSITIAGSDMLALTAAERRAVRRTSVGAIGQNPITSMDPTRRIASAFDDIRCPPSDARTLLGSVGLSDAERILRSYPHQLSGGMAQRVAIALAIARRPDVLVADEPTSALDNDVADSVLRVLVGLAGERRAALVIVTHDLTVVERFCERVIVMNKGEIVESGRTADVLRHPRDDYTTRLLAATRLRDSVARARHPVSQTPVIEIKDASLSFTSGPPWNRSTSTALSAASLSVFDGEMLGVVGPSGSGKSSVCRLLLGLERADQGVVLVDGEPLSRKRSRRKGAVQVVLQHPDWALNPSALMGKSVAEPLHVVRRTSRKAARAEVATMIERLGMDPALADRYPHELSGGQRQRAAIARALVAGPRLIVFDEAVSSLDVSVQAQVLREISDLQADLGFTGLFVSHDRGAVDYVADRVVRMEAGRVVTADETANGSHAEPHLEGQTDE